MGEKRCPFSRPTAKHTQTNKTWIKIVKCIQDTESCNKESEKLEESSTALAHNPSGESRIHRAAQICTDICYSPEQDRALYNVIV